MSPKRRFQIGRRPEREVDDEIAFHFESRVEDLLSAGVPPEEARRTAEEEFGDVRRVRSDLVAVTRRRAARRSRSEWLRDFAGDAAYTARIAVRSPILALTIAITLGLGLGGASAMYSVAERLLLRGPDHVTEPATLRRLYAHVRTKASGEFTTQNLSYTAYVAIRDRARSIAGAAAYAVTDGRVGRGVDAKPASVGVATAGFFPLLGVRPDRGRFFTEAEDATPNGVRVVVLDHGYWMREFGGADSAIGATITVNAEPFTVIGIAPSGFTGAELRQTDMWMPASAGPHSRSDWPTTWRAQWLTVVVRPKTQLSAAKVDEDLTSTFRASYGGTDQEWKVADIGARSIGYTANGAERPEASIARWLSAVAMLLLIIAGANVANLLIVRVMRRRREIALRLALGVSRARLARLLMLESLAFATFGGVAGLAIAFAGGTMIRRVFPANIAWTTSVVSARVVAVAVALTLVAGALIGLVPMAQALATDLASSLRAAGGAQESARSSRLRQILVGIQTAFSLLLLVGAGLFIRSMSNVQRLDLGVEPEHVLVARMAWPQDARAEDTAASRARLANTWKEVRERIAHVPGIDHAALAIGSPFGSGFGVRVRVPGRDTLPTAPGGGPYVSAVGADYFPTTGTKLVTGRPFTTNDGRESPRMAIVNQTMASLLWPRETAIGKCIIVANAPCATVIGVAMDARRFAINEPASMQYYVPYGQEVEFGGPPALLVRPTGEAKPFTPRLRQAILAALPNATYLNISPMQDRVDAQTRPWRMGAMMFALFGGLALLIAAIGLYGAIAYSVAQRTREFGIRLAVGAGNGHLMRAVLWEGTRSAGTGLALGTLGGLIVAGRIGPLLFHVSPRDPFVFGSAAFVLLATAACASVIPAWRAARTDPLVALRSQ